MTGPFPPFGIHGRAWNPSPPLFGGYAWDIALIMHLQAVKASIQMHHISFNMHSENTLDQIWPKFLSQSLFCWLMETITINYSVLVGCGVYSWMINEEIFMVDEFILLCYFCVHVMLWKNMSGLICWWGDKSYDHIFLPWGYTTHPIFCYGFRTKGTNICCLKEGPHAVSLQYRKLFMF